MRGLKKLLTGILAGAMALSMTISAGNAMTANAASSIKITPQSTTDGTVDEITYSYYQILRADIDEDATITGGPDDNAVISYYLKTGATDTKDKAMLALLTGENGIFEATPSADGTKSIITLTKDETGKDRTGDAVRDFLNTTEIKAAALNDISKDDAGNAKNEFKYDSEKGYAEITGLEEGYYLVVSSLGSVVALQTVGTVDITEKNTYITTNKTTSETSYNVGDVVTYTATVTIPASTEVGSNVVLHDTMTADVLSFNNDVTAKIGTVAFTGFNTPVVYTKENPSNKGYTFDVTIPVTTELLDKTITFTYTATVTAAAATDTGLVNTLFGENNGYETKPTSPEVWTFDFDLDKEFQDVTGDDKANYEATFEMTDAEGTVLKFDNVVTNGVTDTTKYVYNKNGSLSVLTVNGLDNINVKGLKAGTYYLTEKTTATGYNLLPDVIKVTIVDKTKLDDNGHPTSAISHEVQYQIGTGNSATGIVTVENKHGALLPSTGGIGTTIFYIIGGLLIVAAAVFFVVRRKAD